MGGCVLHSLIRFFMVWFVRENIIAGNFGFARYWHQISAVAYSD